MAGRPIERCVPALCFVFLSLLLSRTVAAGATPSSAIKAVNLGGWLVADPVITPSLFEGISNSDLLDGSQVQLKSVTTGKYLCAEGGGGSIIVANGPVVNRSVTFTLWRVDATHFQFRVYGNQFIGLEAGRGAEAVATASTPGTQETFEIVRRPGDPDRVRIRAHNSRFLQAKIETSVTADSSGDGSWGDDDPSVFLMTTVSGIRGEFQVTNGYGPDRAPTVMREHWRTFIVKKDFQFMAEIGLDAVRIPVGWWIASGSKPPAPFVGGSLEALDNAFTWAGNYGLKVIIHLRAAPGAQNGLGSSGSRDGSHVWGSTNESIWQTVDVIDFLARRWQRTTMMFTWQSTLRAG